MEFQIISDLHLDQLKYPYRLSTIEKMIYPKSPILVLAGDICHIEKIENHTVFFDYISESFEYVIYIPGNHEFYGKEKGIEQLEKIIDSFFTQRYKNIYYLNNRSIIIENVIFTGSCLWCNPIVQDPPPWFRANLTKEELGEMYEKSVSYLEKVSSLKNGKKHVIITHYPPIHTKNYYMNMNKDIENDILYLFENSSKYKKYEEYYQNKDITLQYSPDLWIFGHTHMNFDKYIGETRYLSNQKKDKKCYKNFFSVYI